MMSDLRSRWLCMRPHGLKLHCEHFWCWPHWWPLFWGVPSRRNLTYTKDVLKSIRFACLRSTGELQGGDWYIGDHCLRQYWDNHCLTSFDLGAKYQWGNYQGVLNQRGRPIQERHDQHFCPCPPQNTFPFSMKISFFILNTYNVKANLPDDMKSGI